MRKFLSALFGIVLMAVLTAPTAVASAEQSPSNPPSAPAHPVKAPIVQGAKLKERNTCANITHAKRAQAAAAGKYIACVRPATPAELKKMRIETSERELREMTSVNGNVEVPDWCYDPENNDGYWHANRFQMCAIGHDTVTIHHPTTGAVTGVLYTVNVYYAFTNNRISNWQYQVDISATTQSWGAAIGGTTVSGTGACYGACSATQVSFPTGQRIDPGYYAHGNVNTNTTATAAGEVGFSYQALERTYNNVKWVGPATAAAINTLDVRCDTALPGNTTTGCVYPEAKMFLIYERGGEVAEVADHIGDAQASGLPGGYGSGTYLHRLTNAVLKQKNRETACPKSRPRPPGKSCDEYPFASTYEGAYTSDVG